MNDDQWYRAPISQPENDEPYRISLNVFDQQDLGIPTLQRMNYPVHVPASLFTTPSLPPSLYAVVENAQQESWQQEVAPEIEMTGTSSSEDDFDLPATIVPGSFLDRRLRMARPQVKIDDYEMADQTENEQTAIPRVDSAVEMLNDPLTFGDADDTGYYESNSPVQGDIYSRQPTSLQYHLIQTNVRDSGLVLEDILDDHMYDDLPPRINSLSLSSEDQTLHCELCAKVFTGAWATRNLARHIEQGHSSSSHFPCSVSKCPRFFRRADARLVHERRSHPELNRPPPIRRKKSGEP